MAMQGPFYHPDLIQVQAPVCSIIIPLYNRVEQTRQCLEALANHTGNSIAFELILIDNASSDATPEYLRTLTGNVTVLTNKIPFSIAKACNQGSRLAVGEYLVFLRQSIYPQHQWLQTLMDALAKSDAMAAGARVLSPDGHVRHAGVAFDEQLLPYNIFSGFAGDSPAAGRTRSMQAVSGACLLVRRDLFQQAGGFNEGYQNGLEDVDFCLRLGKGEKKILYAADSLLVGHADGCDPGSGYQNLERFLASWQGKINSDDHAYYQVEGFVKKTMPDGRTYILPVIETQESESVTAPTTVTEQPASRTTSENLLSAEQWYQRAQELLAGNHRDEATQALEQAVAANPAYAQACNDLAVMLVQQGKLERGLELHKQAVSLKPENVTFRKNLADLYFVGFNCLDEPVEIYTKILAAYPDDVETLLALSQISRSVNRPEEARIFLERVVRIEPDNEVAQQLLQTVTAASTFPQSQLSPEESYAEAGRLAQAGDRSGAIRELESLLTKQPDMAVAHNDLGVLYFQVGDLERSLLFHERAVLLAPGNLTFRKNLAELYLVSFGRVDEAIGIFVDIQKDYPSDEETLFALAQISLIVDRPEEARIFASRLLMLHPGHAPAVELLSLIEKPDTSAASCQQARQLADAGKFSQAIALLERIVAEEAAPAVAWNDLGVLCWNSGDAARALVCHEKAFELLPDDLTFRKNLADVYAVGFGRIDEAIVILTDIVKDHPGDTELLASIGQLCVASNRLVDAGIIFKRIIELDPSDLISSQYLEELKDMGSNFFLAGKQN